MVALVRWGLWYTYRWFVVFRPTGSRVSVGIVAKSGTRVVTMSTADARSYYRRLIRCCNAKPLPDVTTSTHRYRMSAIRNALAVHHVRALGMEARS
jgi:hypothetical protein